jgi:hypothetical protein
MSKKFRVGSCLVSVSLLAGLCGISACTEEDGVASGDGGSGGTDGGSAGDSPGPEHDAAASGEAEAGSLDASLDGSVDASVDAAIDASDAGPTPPSINGAALQLWLTSDKGLACSAATPSRVISWADQSGKGRHATAAALGPRCNMVAGGTDVVDFTKPADTTAPIDDETLDVDLSFLVGQSYTIVVVEKAQSVADGEHAGILGTTMPVGDSPGNRALQLEYGPGSLTFAHHGFAGPVVAAPLPAEAPAISVAWFDPALGHRLYRNGAMNEVTTNKGALVVAAAGAIGRSFSESSDGRYRGTIAEVIVYTAALSDSDRARLDGYLRAHWALPLAGGGGN